VKIFDETYERKAEVATIGGLSAHAGQKLLTEYAQASQRTLKKIFLVHGEQGPAEALQGKLGALGITETYYPDLHEVAEI
jgi:metallo-beta-lactamase family protein